MTFLELWDLDLNSKFLFDYVSSNMKLFKSFFSTIYIIYSHLIH